MLQLKETPISAIFKWLLIVVIIGIITGWIRYWIGYYILLQGVIVGLIIPWGVHKIAKEHQYYLTVAQYKMTIVLFFTFMISQAVGFGIAQPSFDPFGWLGRVWNGDTMESIFGIFSTGGVAHQAFSEGLSGGFWLFLSFMDILFMFFFILVMLPLKKIKNKS